VSPAAKPKPFQPILTFDIQTDADRLAVAAVHGIQRDLEQSMHTERNAKQTIGISEIGTDCMRCLARKVALLTPKVESVSWRAHVGTMMHAYFEDYFGEKYLPDPANGVQQTEFPTDDAPLYHMERKLVIHDFGQFVLEGSCDMFIEGASFGVVNDWKTKSQTALAKLSNGKVGSTYYIQANTYAYGWALLGKKVTHTLIYGLPRDGELDEAKPILMRYDEQVVIERIALIENLIAAAEIAGWSAVIDAQQQAGHCFDCQRFDAADSGSFISNLTGGE
jgi:hypothetical protein